MKRAAVVLLSAVIASAASAQASLFAYDRSVALNARVVERMDSAKFVREKVVFDGGQGGRVPALVVMPKDGAARHPLIVLLDGIGGWKERWWSATSWNRGRILIDSLLAAGFAVAMADAPASGERTFENDFVSAESFIRDTARWRVMGIRNAIETRRLMDYLASRSDVDSTRFGMLGLSHGGMMTFALAATDPRIKAGAAGLAPLQNIPDVLMPPRYATSVRAPMLLMFGTKDAWYTRDQVDRVHAALPSAEKKLVIYDVGHRVPEEYAAEATRWFSRFLARP